MFVFPSQKHKLPALHIFVILLHQILLILVTILIIHLFPAGLPACFPHGHNQGAKVVSKLVSNMHSMKRIKEVSLTHDRLGLDHNMAQKGRISGKHCNCCRGKFQMRSLKLLQRNCHVFYNLSTEGEDCRTSLCGFLEDNFFQSEELLGYETESYVKL